MLGALWRRLFGPSPAELARRADDEKRRAFWSGGLYKLPPLEVWDRMPSEVQLDLLVNEIVTPEQAWGRQC